MRVLWITNIPSPYRLKFFSELGKNIDLTVLFEKGFSSERDETWKDFSFVNYTGVVLKGFSVSTDMSLSFGYKKYIRAFKNNIIVVSNPITPTGISAILYMQSHQIKYLIESDGAFPKQRSGIRGFLKTRLYSRAQLCLTTSDLGKQYFLNYRVSESLIVKYPFTSVYEREVIGVDDYILLKSTYREKLSICEQKMILSVGQFIPRKGFENLLLAARFLDKNAGVYLIGGVPGEEYLSLLDEETSKRVHFFPFMKPDKVKEYYIAADVFAFPTHEDIWGLVVNEAMSQATPVVSTDKCISGLEMIVNGNNGYIVKDSDVESLAKRINEVLCSNNFGTMCVNSIKTAKMFTIEKMAAKHIEIFNSYMSEKQE